MWLEMTAEFIITSWHFEAQIHSAWVYDPWFRHQNSEYLRVVIEMVLGILSSSRTVRLTWPNTTKCIYWSVVVTLDRCGSRRGLDKTHDTRKYNIKYLKSCLVTVFRKAVI